MLCSALTAAAVHYVLKRKDKRTEPPMKSLPRSETAASPAAFGLKETSLLSETQTTPPNLIQAEAELTEQDTVIIVSHQLPIKVKRNEEGGFHVEWDLERVALNKRALNLPMQCIYVGCIAIRVEDEFEQEELEKRLLAEFGCVVVFLDHDLSRCLAGSFRISHRAPSKHLTSASQAASGGAHQHGSQCPRGPCRRSTRVYAATSTKASAAAT